MLKLFARRHTAKRTHTHMRYRAEPSRAEQEQRDKTERESILAGDEREIKTLLLTINTNNFLVGTLQLLFIQFYFFHPFSASQSIW